MAYNYNECVLHKATTVTCIYFVAERLYTMMRLGTHFIYCALKSTCPRENPKAKLQMKALTVTANWIDFKGLFVVIYF